MGLISWVSVKVCRGDNNRSLWVYRVSLLMLRRFSRLFGCFNESRIFDEDSRVYSSDFTVWLFIWRLPLLALFELLLDHWNLSSAWIFSSRLVQSWGRLKVLKGRWVECWRSEGTAKLSHVCRPSKRCLVQKQSSFVEVRWNDWFCFHRCFQYCLIKFYHSTWLSLMTNRIAFITWFSFLWIMLFGLHTQRLLRNLSQVVKLWKVWNRTIRLAFDKSGSLGIWHSRIPVVLSELWFWLVVIVHFQIYIWS